MNAQAFNKLRAERKVEHPEKGLTFSRPNTKLKKLTKAIGRKVRSFDLLAGYACPFALKCKSCAVPVNGTRVIKDGKATEFRCYSAMQEVMYTETFAMRYRNLRLLKDCRSMQGMRDLLLAAMPPGDTVVRLHVSGDFFSNAYYIAWCEVGWKLLEEQRPVTIYGYTKALPLLVQCAPPPNLRLTLSRGGTNDNLITYLKRSRDLHECVVVRSEEEAAERGLPLECGDDTMAYNAEQDFAIVVHGMQPAKGKT